MANPRYSAMELATTADYSMPRLDGGEYSSLGPAEIISGGLTHSESMEITNDPRFFQDSVLTQRLAAFASLGVVAGLMVQNALDQLFGMSKRMEIDFSSLDGTLQTIAFFLLTLVMFLNVIATYVGVAQPYHTIRLMTAGPSGFEASACYYLNPNICVWRHFAVSGALSSLPVFLVSTGLRMVVKFDRENYDFGDPNHKHPPWHSRVLGITTCTIFVVSALLLGYVHYVHFAVFNEKYKLLKPNLSQHRDVLETMSTRVFGPRGVKSG